MDRRAVQVVGRDAGGAGRVLVLRADGSLHALPGPAAMPARSASALREVDPRAPARILAAVRRDRGRRARVTYYALTQSPIDGRLLWAAFLDGGRKGYRADGAGRDVQRLG